MAASSGKTRVAILGASGYTGAELLRILAHHPNTAINVLTADRQAGKRIGAVFPHLARHVLPDLVAIPDVDWSTLDLVFCCLPHGTTQEVISALPAHLKVLDLSADFRLADPEVYAKWYGHAHRAVGLQREAVYGLTEVARADIAKARLIAVPGCYPTGAQLPLIPLLKADQIDPDSIVIDSK
ncbi:MAG TPA: N-acetyl-gamma-glutamyl-phosphate reductase, partial [Stellaceae bacterium]|nr:N-acetyl-gamma-glutamyl-phosphate reductase [Stellaceae bacterium]